MAWFLKSYRCEECGVAWTDEWSCACNDRCPECDAETEPYEYVDLSVKVQARESGRRWSVLVSAADAEHKPNYVETRFERKQDAEAFANREIKRLADYQE
jgi:hypothetical protein